MRQLALAVVLFTASVVPFQRGCAGPHDALVRRLGGALAEALGPTAEVFQTSQDTVRVERRAAIARFVDDPERSSTGYALLALWAWLAVAGGSIRRRVTSALLSAAVLVPTQALAVACEAVAAYRNSVAAMNLGVSDRYRDGTVVLGALAIVSTAIACKLLPIALAVGLRPRPASSGGTSHGAHRASQRAH